LGRISIKKEWTKNSKLAVMGLIGSIIVIMSILIRFDYMVIFLKREWHTSINLPSIKKEHAL